MANIERIESFDLDLKTLEHVHFMFEIQSDCSSSNNGFRRLKELIKETRKRQNDTDKG